MKFQECVVFTCSCCRHEDICDDKRVEKNGQA